MKVSRGELQGETSNKQVKDKIFFFGDSIWQEIKNGV